MRIRAEQEAVVSIYISQWHQWDAIIRDIRTLLPPRGQIGHIRQQVNQPCVTPKKFVFNQKLLYIYFSLLCFLMVDQQITSQKRQQRQRSDVK